MDSCSESFKNQLLMILNEIRSNHGTPPLEYSYNLENYSQEYVLYLKEIQPNLRRLTTAQSWLTSFVELNRPVEQHEPNNRFKEDIVYTRDMQQSDVLVCHKDILEQFKLLPMNYSYYGTEPPKSNIDGNPYDDFTRVLWRNSTKVGFGCGLKEWINTWDNNENNSFLRNTNFYRSIVVLNFNPPGNIPCQYRQNVLPEINSDLYQELVELSGGNLDNIPMDDSCLSPTVTPSTSTSSTTTTTFTLSPSTCPTPSSLNENQNENHSCPFFIYESLLDAINQYRQKNNASGLLTGPLQLSDEITQGYSQPWASYLAQRYDPWKLQPLNPYHELIYTHTQEGNFENFDGQIVIDFWETMDSLRKPAVSTMPKITPKDNDYSPLIIQISDNITSLLQQQQESFEFYDNYFITSQMYYPFNGLINSLLWPNSRYVGIGCAIHTIKSGNQNFGINGTNEPQRTNNERYFIVVDVDHYEQSNVQPGISTTTSRLFQASSTIPISPYSSRSTTPTSTAVSIARFNSSLSFNTSKSTPLLLNQSIQPTTTPILSFTTEDYVDEVGSNIIIG